MRVLHRSGGVLRRLALAALLALVLAPEASQAQQATAGGRRRVPCTDCEAEVRRGRALEKLDSLRWQFEHERLTDADRERLRREMAIVVRELQGAIGDLRIQMGDLDRAEAEVWAAAPGAIVAFQARPSGYLGVSFDGPNSEEHRGNERFIRFYAYPRIALVEPSSPADRAGIRAGDTLLAMNGMDVLEREIPLSRLLIPDAQLLVRLRRDGAARQVKVTVGRAPEYVVQRWTPAPSPAAAPMPPGEPPRGAVRVRTPTPARAPTAVPGRAPAVAGVWVYSDGVAGAKVETITEGLGKALGVGRGVLVVRAGPGTPASRAGLRDGDVIVRAAGVNVNTIRELRQQLERNADGDGVKLVIVRERKQREVTLRQ